MRDTPPDLEELVAALLPVQHRGEAAFLLAGAAGLQSPVLLGQLEPDAAVALVDTQLDRIGGR